MIVALVVGTLLAVGALAFVLQPLFLDNARPIEQKPRFPELPDEASAIAALREIEFDRATGKLSETDYAQLKARYTREAVREMRREKQMPEKPLPTDDEIEAAVSAYRAKLAACPDCGPRPEADAVFCSNCGRYLRETCGACGRRVVERDGRFCNNCGSRLA
jgi:hypothetical protein